jgi:hypothetical protein
VLNSEKRNAERGLKSTLTSGFQIMKKHPAAGRLLLFSFVYNFCLMGPFEIGHVTMLRRDLGLPPEVLAVNLLLFLGGIFAGTFAADRFWKKGKADHLRRFSKAIFWDGITFFPICIFVAAKEGIPRTFFLGGLATLFFLHYMLVPFVKVSRLAGLQEWTDQRDWSALLGFHTVAVEGASALSVILVALAFPSLSGTLLLGLGGAGAALCGLFGLRLLVTQSPEPEKHVSFTPDSAPQIGESNPMPRPPP